MSRPVKLSHLLFANKVEWCVFVLGPLQKQAQELKHACWLNFGPVQSIFLATGVWLTRYYLLIVTIFSNFFLPVILSSRITINNSGPTARFLVTSINKYGFIDWSEEAGLNSSRVTHIVILVFNCLKKLLKHLWLWEERVLLHLLQKRNA